MKPSMSRQILKWLAQHLRVPLLILLRVFFDEKHLRGRHFDTALSGYVWGLSAIWQRNILRLAPPLRFPASYRASISNSENIEFHPDDLNNFQSPGTYFQNFNGNIIIGRGSYVAPNVGFITANHDVKNLDQHLDARSIVLGERCWIGMNAVLLPGVVLGAGTIVGAGSVVTKSFPHGNCVIGGNPARLIREVAREV